MNRTEIATEKKPETTRTTTTRKGDKKSFSPVKFLLSLALAVFLITTLGTILIIIASNFKLVSFAEIFATTREVMIIIFVIIVLFLAVIAAIAYSVFVFFAPRDLFFTSVEEGRAKAIMKGTIAGGEFSKIIMSFEKYTFDEDWNIVYTGNKEKHLLGGVRWLGIPGIFHIHNYKFKWVSMDEQGNKKVSDKVLDYIYVKKDIYVETLKGAEVGLTMVPVDIEIYITARVINPYKALFRAEKWLEYVLNRSKVPLRDYIGKQSGPQELITSKENLGKFLFEKLEESGMLENFRNEIGIEIEKLETPDIDMGEFQALATAEWKAEQEGKAEVVKKTKEGEAYGAFMGKKKKADNDYYNMIKDLGDLGTTMKYLETAEKASTMVIPFGMIGDVARQILTGGRSPDDIDKLLKEAGLTKEDLKELIEMAKSIKEKSKEE